MQNPSSLPSESVITQFLDDVEDALKQYKKDFITLMTMLKDETSEWSVSVKRVQSFLC